MTDDHTSSEPWTRHESFAEMEASMRANLAEMEERVHAQVRETFAKHRERLEADLARAGQDLAVQRGELH